VQPQLQTHTFAQVPVCCIAMTEGGEQQDSFRAAAWQHDRSVAEKSFLGEQYRRAGRCNITEPQRRRRAQEQLQSASTAARRRGSVAERQSSRVVQPVFSNVKNPYVCRIAGVPQCHEGGQQQDSFRAAAWQHGATAADWSGSMAEWRSGRTAVWAERQSVTAAERQSSRPDLLVGLQHLCQHGSGHAMQRQLHDVTPGLIIMLKWHPCVHSAV
jgi:hypothetical protein